MKRVILAPHMKCNAHCSHCCVSSHPKDERRLADTDVQRLVDEAIAATDVEVISFTGGEALLRPAFILDLIRRVSRAGKRTTLVSNGFWGVTPKAARQQLTELQDAGLCVLTLSTDAFHAPYVPVRRIKNILDARCCAPNIKVLLNMVESKSHRADEVLTELGSSVEGIRITRISITPAGAAATLPSDEIAYCATPVDRLRCPGQTLLVSGNDQTYPCCSIGVINSALSVGRASKLTVEEAARRIERNLMFHIISREGFRWIVEELKAQGIDKYQSPFPVVDACHLCCEIFSNHEHVALLRPALLRYRQEYLASRS